MTPTRILVLGIIIRRNQAHGYQVMQDLKSWEADQWSNIQTGSVYHALHKMEKEGLILACGTEKGTDGPKRTKYTITKPGREAFIRHIRAGLCSLDMYKLSAAVAFMEYIAKEEAIELLTKNINDQQEILSYLNTIRIEEAPKSPAENGKLIRIWRNYHKTNVLTIKTIINELS